jgi:hypothetical protein
VVIPIIKPQADRTELRAAIHGSTQRPMLHALQAALHHVSEQKAVRRELSEDLVQAGSEGKLATESVRLLIVEELALHPILTQLTPDLAEVLPDQMAREETQRPDLPAQLAAVAMPVTGDRVPHTAKQYVLRTITKTDAVSQAEMAQNGVHTVPAAAEAPTAMRVEAPEDNMAVARREE